MLAIQINNQELENSFLEFAKTQKQSIENIASEAIKYFISQKNRHDTTYTKKDVSKHIRKIQRDYTDVSEDIALTHIDNSAEFIHNLRRN
jgi:hypothetical protein